MHFVHRTYFAQTWLNHVEQSALLFSSSGKYNVLDICQKATIIQSILLWRYPARKKDSYMVVDKSTLSSVINLVVSVHALYEYGKLGDCEDRYRMVL